MKAGKWRWSSAGATCRRKWAGSWLAILCAANASAASYHFAAVWDGSKLWKDACVTVEGERITAVGPCSGASVDLTRFTAIPGMIDVHTHITYSYDPESGLDPWNQGRREPETIVGGFAIDQKSHAGGCVIVRNPSTVTATLFSNDKEKRDARLATGPNALGSGHLRHQDALRVA